MGSAYTLAHKEGHNRLLYRKWVRHSAGNVFENVLGPLFGIVPHSFTTAHIHIHHALDGGRGDSFYMWDVDRTSFADFLFFVARIFAHMCCVSSLRYFWVHNMRFQFYQLLRGAIIYWVCVPALFYSLTGSMSLLFWAWFQPLIGMTVFLSVINWAFHGFLAFDENGKMIPCVNATCIIDGPDDSFGEDDHMAHHFLIDP